MGVDKCMKFSQRADKSKMKCVNKKCQHNLAAHNMAPHSIAWDTESSIIFLFSLFASLAMGNYACN